MMVIIFFFVVYWFGNMDRGISLLDKEKNLDVNKVCLNFVSYDG